MAVLKREYEISVWHEKLNENGNKLEEKMAVIGAHDMTYLGRATNVHFQTKMNGTHQLTFQLPDKYFDSEKGDFVQNEFKDYLLNESKVKLKYKDEWYEFYIKTVKDTKHYKSYMKNYTCTDAYIDELSRNGYGITFDTELYNNVEEIGIFTDEILDGSLWEYSPENNWGDFTEYTEEKLFKIPVSQFGGTVSGYKLNFNINSDLTINNIYTKEKRGLQLGDDLAASTEENDGYFWDCYDNNKRVDWTQVDNIPNDGYIYVPYSQLNFCYVTNTNNDSGNFHPATESPYYEVGKSYLLAPPTINPKALIQFIAIPEGAEIEVDEAGLIVNKNYTYVMTNENWNNTVTTNYWYTQDITRDDNGDFKKEVKKQSSAPSQKWFYNKGVFYEGYLDNIGGLAIESGKRISISDRTEINISDKIDQYVKVYKEKSQSFNGLYSLNSAEWKGTIENYRVCSATRTRQIIPQLARNYFENATNIKSVNGWAVMGEKNLSFADNEKNTTVSYYHYDKSISQAPQGGFIQVEKGTLRETTGSPLYNTIVNFGAVGQKKTIQKNKVYCFGIEFDNSTNNLVLPTQVIFKIGQGQLGTFSDSANRDEANYSIINSLNYTLTLNGNKEYFCLIRPKHDIENPYLCLNFGNTPKVIIKEVWFFEAYTKGQDQFDNASFKYSGRDYIWNYGQNVNISGRIEREELENKILFETDIMRGDTYGYQEYFIQQLVPKDANYGIDTFKAKKYISEDADTKETYTALPLPASEFTEDDYEIVTNYIDLNRCIYYKGNNTMGDLDCSYNYPSGEATHFCMYQKYGYCPYMFTTEKHCRKIRTLSGSKSNRFNLTQELGKVFEVYPQYYIEHTSNGNVKTDEDGRAIKKVFYITEKGLENKIGFRYEKNLANIDRTIVSDKIVTKLYVLDVDSELSKTGLCSIKTAEDNPSKDSFIIDLSYYIQQGMLDKEQTMADLYGIDNTKLGFLKQLGYYNEQYDILTNKIIELQNQSYNDLQSKVEVDITGYGTVLEEIRKINKQLSRYTKADDRNNDSYKNYKEKLDQQEARKEAILQELLGNSDVTISVQELRDKYDEKQPIAGTSGLYAQFLKEYSAIQEWKKERAKYLKDINALTKEFYSIYEPYLKEGTWSNNNYLTDNAYYHDALDVAAEGAIPKVTYSIKVVPLGILDENYEIGIADTTYIEDIGMFGINKKTGLPNRLKVIISELNESLDKPSEDSITIQNFTTQFEDLFQQVTASVQSLTYNENIYKRSSNFTSNQNVKTESLQGTLDNNDLILLDTSESNIKLDAKGQSGSDITNHNNKYKLDGQGLFFSNNGGQSWNVGVGPDGINADYINTGTLDAGNIRIIDNSYIYFLWDKSGITAYKEPYKVAGSTDVIFGKDYARFNKAGLSLIEGGQVRLRAGYGISSNDDPYATNGDMGFYLYDNKGKTIFSTTTTNSTGEDNISAQISLAGQIYAHEKSNTYQDATYTYTNIYNLINVPVYHTIGTNTAREEDLIEVSIQIDIFTSTNGFYSVDSYYLNEQTGKKYIKQGTQYKELIEHSNGRYIEAVSGNPLVVKNKLPNPTHFSNIYDNSTNVKRTRTVDLYCKPNEANPYYETEQYNPPSHAESGKIGVFLNNRLDSEQSTTQAGFAKRIFSAIKDTGATPRSDGTKDYVNIFTILDSGSLYIGGTLTANGGTGLEDISSFAKVVTKNEGIELTPSGQILLNGINLSDAVSQEIAEIKRQVENAGVPIHSHTVPQLTVNHNMVAGNTTVDYMQVYWDRPQHGDRNSNPIINLPGTNQIRRENLNLENSLIALVEKREDFEQGTTSDVSHSPIINKVTLKFVKTSDLLNAISLKTNEGLTGQTGTEGGSGGYINPEQYSNSAIVTQAYKVITALYNKMVTNYQGSQFYSNYYCIYPTIDGKQLAVRRDCSGFVNGVWQLLGDMSVAASQGGTTYTYRTNHPNNWELISLSSLGYNPANLRPGDVIFREGATKGFGDGHTELITEIIGNQVKSYGFGGDYYLRQSYNNNNYLGSLTDYDYILRRRNDYENIPSNGYELIDRSVYDAHPSSGDNRSAINYYFNGQLSESYVGPYPSTREIYQSDRCKGLRCIVDLCMHEFGGWKFAAVSYAKLVRAYLIGSGYVKGFDYNSSGRRSTNLYEWMWNITHNTQGIFGSWSINDGSHNMNIDLKIAQAVYNNLRYPNIYGADLHEGSAIFKNQIKRAINGIPTSNGGYWSLIRLADCYSDYKSDTDYHTEADLPQLNSYYGRFCMYRIPNNMNIFNDVAL